MVLQHRTFAILLAFLICAQAPAQTAPAPPADPLRRTTPQSSIFNFLEACHRQDYKRAAHYMDLRKMPSSQRLAQGPELARKLEDLLDRDAQFDVTDLSTAPEGDTTDGLPAE